MPQISDIELSRLKGAVDELATLNQIASAINVTMSVDDITATIVDHCRRRVKAEQGAIFLLENDTQNADRFKTFVRRVDKTEGLIPFHLNQSLQGWMVKNRAPLKANDPDHDDRLRGVNFAALGMHSLVAAPLMARSGLIGLLTLFNKQAEGGFTDFDQRFLGIVGTQVAKVIENARLFEQQQRLAEMEKEMKIAQSIQAGFLPRENLETDKVRVLGFNVPAREVGGDYFDIIPLNDDDVFLSLGDISGKGLPAALLMSNAQAVLRSRLHGTVAPDLPVLADCLNQLIYHFTAPDQYITGTFGIYNSTSATYSYINAGHLPPLIVRGDGTIEKPATADLIFGVMPGAPFHTLTVELRPGDRMYLYTDGVTEANNPAGDMFGDDRWDELARSCRTLSATESCKAVQTAIREFRGAAAQSDDVTVLLLEIP
ncbi:MAG: SpoIIE family protein phosphatase [candidate division Zixibacteria bacterium]|nr:SpoIIE family protein phosphatase [candidate division Zixibacteria bacterium]